MNEETFHSRMSDGFFFLATKNKEFKYRSILFFVAFRNVDMDVNLILLTTIGGRIIRKKENLILLYIFLSNSIEPF